MLSARNLIREERALETARQNKAISWAFGIERDPATILPHPFSSWIVIFFTAPFKWQVRSPLFQQLQGILCSPFSTTLVYWDQFPLVSGYKGHFQLKLRPQWEGKAIDRGKNTVSLSGIWTWKASFQLTFSARLMTGMCRFFGECKSMAYKSINIGPNPFATISLPGFSRFHRMIPLRLPWSHSITETFKVVKNAWTALKAWHWAWLAHKLWDL